MTITHAITFFVLLVSLMTNAKYINKFYNEKEQDAYESIIYLLFLALFVIIVFINYPLPWKISTFTD